ncbi:MULTISPECIES: Fic family protein [unclassified Phenylobacterium]|uniref:Fic family protein n=1 Tax=unclassified Phenylobacterium TaxID=2640670 RepID=UPI0009E991B4
MLIRPPESVLTFYFWKRLPNLLSDLLLLEEVSSCLLGHPSILRRGPCFSNPDLTGVRYEFPKACHPEIWLEEVRANASRTDSALLNAWMAMATLVMRHPFQDGNGRTGRAVFYSVLADSGLIGAPCLGLAVVSKIQGGALVEQYRMLGLAGSWAEFCEFAVVITELCCNTVSHIMEHKSCLTYPTLLAKSSSSAPAPSAAMRLSTGASTGAG